MRRTLLALFIVATLGLLPTAHAADVTPQQLQPLEARIAKLESDDAVLRQQVAEATAAAQAAQAEVARLKAARIDAAADTQTAQAASPEDEIEALAATPDAASIEDSQALAATPASERADAMSAETATLAATPSSGGGTGSGANAFNPALAIIVNGSYSHHSLDPDAYARAGFPLVGEARPSANGFSMGESEISLSANIDDKFYGQLTLAAESDDGVDQIGIEEAYIDTTALPAGFSLRVGRFYSNIGYLNGHHPHTDSFFDRPLPYQAFLGNQYGDDGVQVRWVAPTSIFLELGGEIFRGDSYPSGGAQHGGLGTRTVFANIGGAAGANNEWLTGVSILSSRADNAEDGFSGDSTLYIADGTWKWAPNGAFKDAGITLRGEYFQDKRDGTYTDPQKLDSGGPMLTSPWSGQRRGAYLEGIYRFNSTWDIGYRYDKLWAFDPYRHSAELTWRNSEFSLLRLQLSRDKPNADDSDNAITVQYQAAFGAHGAHKF